MEGPGFDPAEALREGLAGGAACACHLAGEHLPLSKRFPQNCVPHGVGGVGPRLRAARPTTPCRLRAPLQTLWFPFLLWPPGSRPPAGHFYGKLLYGPLCLARMQRFPQPSTLIYLVFA